MSPSITQPLRAHVTKPSLLLHKPRPPVGYWVELVRAWIKLINSNKKYTYFYIDKPNQFQNDLIFVWHGIRLKGFTQMASNFVLKYFGFAFGCFL